MRADNRAVLDQAARLQLVAKGEAEPLVETADGVSQAENRAVIIAWRK